MVIFFLFNYQTMWCYKDDVYSYCVYLYVCLVMENNIDISILHQLNVAVVGFFKFQTIVVTQQLSVGSAGSAWPRAPHERGVTKSSQFLQLTKQKTKSLPLAMSVLSCFSKKMNWLGWQIFGGPTFKFLVRSRFACCKYVYLIYFFRLIYTRIFRISI